MAVINVQLPGTGWCEWLLSKWGQLSAVKLTFLVTLEVACDMIDCHHGCCLLLCVLSFPLEIFFLCCSAEASSGNLRSIYETRDIVKQLISWKWLGNKITFCLNYSPVFILLLSTWWIFRSNFSLRYRLNCFMHHAKVWLVSSWFTE